MAPWLHHGLQWSPEPKWTPAPATQRGQEIANLSKSGLFQPGNKDGLIQHIQYSTSSTSRKLQITSTSKSCDSQPASICFFRPWTGSLTYTGRCNQCGCRKGRIYRYCSGILPKAIWYFGGKPTMLIYYILTNNLEILRIQKLSKPRLEFDHHPYASDKWTGDDNQNTFCCLLHIMLSCASPKQPLKSVTILHYTTRHDTILYWPEDFFKGLNMFK